MPWSVVKCEDGKLCIIANNWLNSKKDCCQYPKKVNAYALNALTETCASPKPDWNDYKIIKFYKQDILVFEEAKTELCEIESEESDSNPGTKEVPKKHALPSYPTSESSQSSKRAVDQTAIGSTNVKKLRKSNNSEEAIQSGGRKPPAETMTEYDLLQSLPGTSKSSEVPLQRLTIHDVNDLNETIEPESGKSPDTSREKNPIQASQGSSKSTKAPNIQPPPTLQVNDSNEPNQSKASIFTLLQSLQSSLHSMAKKNKGSTAEADEYDSEEDEKVLSECPLKSVKDVEAFDARLKKSKAMRQRLRLELKPYLTDCEDASCKALASKLMDDNAAQYYSWCGREMKNQVHKKKAFFGTKLCDIIYQTVNFKFATEDKNKMTIKKYQDALSDWFTQAKFRIAGREVRKAARLNRNLMKEAESEFQRRNMESSDSDIEAEN